MRLASALWLCTVGCGFHGSGSGGNKPDAPDTPDGCLGTGAWIVCPPEPPTAQLSLATTLDTTNDTHCKSDPSAWSKHQDDACIVIATDITVGSLTVTGPRPLVLVATGGITITTLLDVSSQITAGRKGPYTPSAACMSTDGSVDTAGGGGGGGSFGLVGGLGGSVNSNNATRGTSGPIAQAPVEKLRGGCPGGNGGIAAASGKRGDGGGAVYLLAGGAITIQGRINASGAGGGGATGQKAGGGGGGSGGMIVLAGASITTQTGVLIFANGGGGGGGSDNGTAAMPGKDPTMPMSAAMGGAAGGGAGRGGAPGGFVTTPAGQGTDAPGTNGGAGGGGGGVGVIRVISGGGLGPALVSPSPT